MTVQQYLSEFFEEANKCLEKQVAGLRETVEDLHHERDEARQHIKRLELLTPGGSEFYDDPKRCIDWIEERIGVKNRQHVELVQARRRVAELEAQAAS